VETFDAQFLDAVIWLLITDNRFVRQYGDKIKPDMFDDKIRFLSASYAKEFYATNRATAKQLFTNYVKDRINRDNVESAVAKLLLAYQEKLRREQTQVVTGYVTRRLDEFILLKHVSGVSLVLQQALDNGNLEEARDLLQQSARMLRPSNGLMKPVDYFATAQQRAHRRQMVQTQKDGVHFMVPSLEKNDVYAHRGDVTIVIAPSKRGKSIFLTHVGKCAVFTGHHVLHVSLENPIHLVEDRYDAMFTGLPVSELRDAAQKFVMTVEEVRGLAKGKLHLLWRPARTYSPLDLKADVAQLRADGIRIDTTIIDYGELMRPVQKTTGDAKLRADRDDIFINLRAVATDDDICVITAQQTPLKKLSKFRIGMEDGQESSMPAQHASLIMTLNQTPDELKYKQMRISVSGYWYGASGAIGDILVVQDIDRMRFCVREMNLEDGVEALKAKGIKP
jgi:hypothetical protein